MTRTRFVHVQYDAIFPPTILLNPQIQNLWIWRLIALLLRHLGNLSLKKEV